MMYEDELEAFGKNHGYRINLDNPRSFNEKVVCKKLFDRNPLLGRTSDKFRARFYIRGKIGFEAEKYLVPLIWVGEKARDISFNRLPGKYIIKPNNASGRYILKNKDFLVNVWYRYKTLTKEQIIEICDLWFKSIHGKNWYEWAYSQIEPLILIEDFIGFANDWRFYMFNGKMGIYQVTSFRNWFANYYDRNGNLLKVNKVGRKNFDVDRPVFFDKMLEFAEILSEPFDFVRIDFLVTDKFYFSELTHYPGSGWTVYDPLEFDFELGSYWNVNRDNYNL